MEYYSIGDRLINYDNFSMSYMEFGKDVSEHKHNVLEMVYVAGGYGEHVVNGESIMVRRGSFIIMNHTCTHQIKTWRTIEYYNLMFKPEFLTEKLEGCVSLKDLLENYYKEECNGEFICVEFTPEEAERVEHLLFQMLEEGINRKKRCRDITKCHLDEVINLALRKDNLQSGYKIDPAMAEAMNYISNNSREVLHLEDVAKIYHYKPGYLSKKLKEYCGMSFKQLLIRKRLADVINSLLDTDKNIDDIIYECGFTNKTYFYDLFEKEYGVKPKFIREYRNHYRKYAELKVRYKMNT